MSEFYEGLAEILEVEPAEITPEFELEGRWDSLAIVSTIALIDEVYDVAVSADQLAGCATVADVEKVAEAQKA